MVKMFNILKKTVNLPKGVDIPPLIKIPEKNDSPELFPPNMDYPYFDRVRFTGFFPEKHEFSLENACFLAEASFVSFNHPAFVKYAMHYAGFGGFRYFAGKNIAKCFAVSSNDAIVVMFRGTEFKLPLVIPGIFADLKFLMAKEQSGFVHSGFKNILDEIWEGKDMLYNYLCSAKIKTPSKKIFFTGHSLGGALALIAASRFADADFVYTFGSPRTGSEAFANSIKAKVFRIVNNNDIVTALPPEKSLINKGEKYVHTGEPIFIDKKGAIGTEISNKFSLKKFLGIETSLFSVDELLTYFSARPNDFVDHSPFLYPAKLWNFYYKTKNSF